LSTYNSIHYPRVGLGWYEDVVVFLDFIPILLLISAGVNKRPFE